MHVGTAPATGHNSCPICGIQLSPDELESHFSAELGRLAKPNMYSERQEIRRTLSMELHAVQSSMQSRSSRWEVSWFDGVFFCWKGNITRCFKHRSVKLLKVHWETPLKNGAGYVAHMYEGGLNGWEELDEEAENLEVKKVRQRRRGLVR